MILFLKKYVFIVVSLAVLASIPAEASENEINVWGKVSSEFFHKLMVAKNKKVTPNTEEALLALIDDAGNNHEIFEVYYALNAYYKKHGDRDKQKAVLVKIFNLDGLDHFGFADDLAYMHYQDGELIEAITMFELYEDRSSYTQLSIDDLHTMAKIYIVQGEKTKASEKTKILMGELKRYFYKNVDIKHTLRSSQWFVELADVYLSLDDRQTALSSLELFISAAAVANRNENIWVYRKYYLDKAFIGLYKSINEELGNWYIKTREGISDQCGLIDRPFYPFIQMQSKTGTQAYTTCEDWAIKDAEMEFKNRNLMHPVEPIVMDFPTREAKKGIEGWTLVSFDISKKGKVKKCKVKKVMPKDAKFGKYACKKLKKVRYRPAMKEGESVEVKGYEQRFAFTFNR